MKTAVLILVISFFGAFTSPLNYANTIKLDKKALPLYSNGHQVHGSFEVLFKNPEFTCYDFVATDDWQPISCNLCKKTYHAQSFKDKNGKLYLMYSNSTCDNSTTGYHDYKQLVEIYPCGCLDIYTNK